MFFATYTACNIFSLITSTLSSLSVVKLQNGQTHSKSVFDHFVGLSLKGLKPEEWVWRLVDKVLKPIKTDMQPVPESRLKFVRCKCKSTLKKEVVKIYVHVENMV